MLLSDTALKQLAEWPEGIDHPVLSVYLQASRSKGLNFNPDFENALKAMFNSIEKKVGARQRELFEADARRIWSFLKNHTPEKDNVKSYIFFCDDAGHFFQSYEIQAPVHNKVVWGTRPYLRPLLELFDEYERFAVVLADRNRARLFSVFLGDIEEIQSLASASPVRHMKETGSDTHRSQMNLQRRAEEHANWHLKKTVEELSRMAERRAFDRLILAGPEEVTAHLECLLPKSLSSRVVAKLPFSMDMHNLQILEETMKIAEKIERDRETKLLDDLTVMAAKGGQAVLGLEPVMAALLQGQVHKVVYQNTPPRSGSRCRECDSFFTEPEVECPYCRKPAETLTDLLESVIERAMDMGGKVEQVKGRVPKAFEEAGRIGAFLRFPMKEGVR